MHISQTVGTMFMKTCTRPTFKEYIRIAFKIFEKYYVQGGPPYKTHFMGNHMYGGYQKANLPGKTLNAVLLGTLCLLKVQSLMKKYGADFEKNWNLYFIRV